MLSLEIRPDTRWHIVRSNGRPVATLQAPGVYAQGLDRCWRVFNSEGGEIFTHLPTDHPAMGGHTPLHRVNTYRAVRDCGLG